MEEWDLISQTLSKCHVLFLGGPKMLKFIFLDSQRQFWLAKDPACSRNKRASRLCQITIRTYPEWQFQKRPHTTQEIQALILEAGEILNSRTLQWHFHSICVRPCLWTNIPSREIPSRAILCGWLIKVRFINLVFRQISTLLEKLFFDEQSLVAVD